MTVVFILCVSCMLYALSVQGSTVHDAQLLYTPNSVVRWLVFPSAKSKHLEQRQQSIASGINAVNADIDTTSSSFSKSAQSVFTAHKDMLGLHSACQMNLAAERRSPSSTMVYQTYQQLVGGVRVFGGDFKVTLSAVATTDEQPVVLNTHGSPLTEETLDAELNDVDVSLALQTAPKLNNIRKSIKTYLSTSRVDMDDAASVDVEDIEIFSNHPVELVWYQPGAESGDVYLAYHVRGSAAASGNFVSYYAFVDFESGNVLKLVQLNDEEHLNDVVTSSGVESLDVSTSAVPPSPFASPISDASIYCYDQYLKDYNDDQDDNYYFPDPDRYSAATLVFDTTSGTHTYPTTDAEMNLLIDNTLYAKYLYYSLSGGEYVTWAKHDTLLNIEYNLSLANAYFDGYWGIHFGTGFITDDVVAHEWSHGYTQTGADLVYERQSGAMNEGFSDIFGESIDILNVDTADTTVLRSSSPASCTSTLNSRYGHGPDPGTDGGNRWSIGEEVSYYTWANGDGSFRDMYKPECFFHPGSTLSPYYACTTYFDHGGVHLNSGVLNHLFAVLVDGGEYVTGAGASATTTTIAALGLDKTLNLFWRAHEQLSAKSDFFDFATTINQVCSLNVGETLYYPNVFNSTIFEVPTLTAADCDVVRSAVSASGMDRTVEECPNIECDLDWCEWATCPLAAEGHFDVFYEDYDYYMGDYRLRGTDGKIEPACSNISSSSYARVFDQNRFHLNEFTLSCIQFGFIMLGSTTVTIDVYVDVDGGDPTYDSLQLLASKTVTTLNANNHMQVQTVSFDTPIEPPYNTSTQNLVVVLTTPLMTEGFIAGGGQINSDIDVYDVPTGQTWVGGACQSELEVSDSSVQWYVRLQGTSTYVAGSTGGDGFDDSEIIAMIVAACIIGVSFIAFSYYVINKNRDKLSNHVPLDHEDGKL